MSTSTTFATDPGAGPFSVEFPNLLQHHLDHLRASGISNEVIKERGYKSVLGKKELADLHFSETQRLVPGLLIPLNSPAGENKLCQYKPDKPRIIKGKSVKYETPQGCGLSIDIPPRCLKNLDDPSVPLWVTEGVKKADALATQGACAVALLGVWGWVGRNTKGGVTTLPEWRDIALNNRPVNIAYDSDVLIKPQVQQALLQISGMLRSRGAKVRWILLPSPDGSKVGIDDYLLHHTLEEALTLAREPEILPKQVGGYAVENGSYVYQKPTPNGIVPTALSEFTATITAEITTDDGIEERREFEIHGALANGSSLPTVRIPAGSFASLSWVTDKWGASAIVNAGSTVKDRLREAIQRFSLSGDGISARRVFTHTGWREIEGKPIFLHAGCNEADVELPRGLDRYSLPDTCPDPRTSFLASMRYLDIAPLSVTLPIWATMYLAPLCELLRPAFMLWVFGSTGNLKSTLVALALCHYGQFNSTNLPASWEDTENTLEKIAFLAKDLPLVIDDFAPQPSWREQKMQERKALRILRAQGNLSGRGRMRSDTSLRGSYPPRGIIISTGEQLPTSGQSTIARLMGVEVDRSKVDINNLTNCQNDSHLFTEAMRVYMDWLAPRFNDLRQTLPEEFRALRSLATRGGQHMRVPETVAWLALGLEQALDFGVTIGAISQEDADSLLAKGWDVLLELSEAQTDRVEMERPTTRFIDIILTLFAQHRAHLNARSGGIPECPEIWGWICSNEMTEADICRPGPTSELIGWHEEDLIYLMPEAAYKVVARFCSEQGEPFLTPKNELLRRLEHEGILIPFSKSGKTERTSSVWCGGQNRRATKLKADAFRKN